MNNFYSGVSSLSGSSESGDGPQKVTLVYFIGGCTYAEVAALRFLSVQDNGKKPQLLGLQITENNMIQAKLPRLIIYRL